MFKSIGVPVDLPHADQLKRSIEVAVDLAKHYGAALNLVGVTGVTPGAAAHNPKEFDEKLRDFAIRLRNEHGVEVGHKSVVSHDPAVDLEEKIGQAAKDLGSDLVVMSSHKPGLLEHIFASHAGHFASHSDLSVFIVR
ncbi:MAG: universal stress protein [Alphaproteobacteria bacterium]|nr:universal stress protein [Alphaproteobacteria bacterium]